MIISTLPAAEVIVYFLFGNANLERSASRRRASIHSVVSESPAILSTLFELRGSHRPHQSSRLRVHFAHQQLPDQRRNPSGAVPDAHGAQHLLIIDMDETTVPVNTSYCNWQAGMTAGNVGHALIPTAARGRMPGDSRLPKSLSEIGDRNDDVRY